MVARPLPLPPEPWGAKFRRAREDVGRYRSLEEAAAAISGYKLCSGSTLSRLEHEPFPPANRGSRATAFVACWVYNVDPAHLDLDPDDVPHELVALLARRKPPRPKNAWFTGDELRDLQVA